MTRVLANNQGEKNGAKWNNISGDEQRIKVELTFWVHLSL